MSRRLEIEWRQYAILRPFDQKRADRRAAIVASAVWNAARTSKSDPKTTLHDQMIDYEGEWEDEEVQLNEEETIAHMLQWANAINNPDG